METFKRMANHVYRLRVPFMGSWTGVTLVRGDVNILVDSGGCAQTVDSAILPALEQLGMSLADIGWLALTHIHGDHVGGGARLKVLSPDLKIAAYADSAARLCDPLAYSRQIRARFPAHSPAAPGVLDGVKMDKALRDGESLGPLLLLHTPGHDTDSCSYLDTRTQTLITGDSLQLNGTASQGCALLMDVPAYRATLERLMALPVECIVCGHDYLPLGDGAVGREKVRRFLLECFACFAHDRGFVAGMAAAGEKDPAAIAKALIQHIGGTMPEYLFLPMYTVSGYLASGAARQE